MHIKAGTRLGPYAIDHLIGAGGMGEVYRARDTRLDRVVALKVLSPALAADAAHLARFQREAKTISALNHAHICALHDIGQHESTHYLVLELLEGETLAARLGRGPLPTSQAERLGAQIADALAAAHRHGLVHRDLKPANVMLTATGVKLLDFGLAKSMAAPVSISPVPATMVGDAPATAEGQIVGTLQYMAPEQVQGLATDARTDIFALGAVLYEMLTGRKAFESPTPAGLIGRILQADPPSVMSLVPATPEALAALVERCLAKDPQERWQSAYDVRLQLEWLQSRASGAMERPAAPTASWRRWRVPLVAGLAGALLAATPLTLLPWRVPETRTDLVPWRFDMTLPPGTVLRAGSLIPDAPEISPDGRWVVYGATVNGRRQLHCRSVTTQASKVLLDNEDVTYPFWSPDSRAVGFFAADNLKTIAVDGGAARLLAPTSFGLGGTWDTGRILFASEAALYTIPEGGGPTKRIEGLPALAGSSFYVGPRLLPGGNAFLVHTWPEPSVWLASLDGPGARLLADGPASWARFAVGHLLLARDGALLARPFDVRAGQFTAPEVSIAEGVRSASTSRDGTILFHAAQGGTRTQPTWFDRKGVREGTLADPTDYRGMTLSPDGRRAATWKVESGNQDVWEIDLATGVLSRLSHDPAPDSDATWSPDGTRLAFTSGRSGAQAVYVREAATGRETLAASLKGRALVVDGWTPDGRALVVRTAERRSQIFLAALDVTASLRQLADFAFTVDETQVSPDGRWIAYHSLESGTWEVYVSRFPELTSRRRVSVAGGVQPKWRGDGKELFYLGPDSSMMSVTVTTGPELTVQRPVRLFATNVNPNPDISQYGVTPDGQRFLGLDRGEPQREVFTVLVNWLTPENLARH